MGRFWSWNSTITRDIRSGEGEDGEEEGLGRQSRERLDAERGRTGGSSRTPGGGPAGESNRMPGEEIPGLGRSNESNPAGAGTQSTLPRTQLALPCTQPALPRTQSALPRKQSQRLPMQKTAQGTDIGPQKLGDLPDVFSDSLLSPPPLVTRKKKMSAAALKAYQKAGAGSLPLPLPIPDEAPLSPAGKAPLRRNHET